MCVHCSYNTDDARCYHDLVRQRGVVYATWEDMSKLVPGSDVRATSSLVCRVGVHA